METRVWSALEGQGRMIKWLARATGIQAKRLYDLKYGGAAWWQDVEVEACAHALGLPRDYLFPAGTRVLAPGRRRPPRPDAQAPRRRGAA